MTLGIVAFTDVVQVEYELEILLTLELQKPFLFVLLLYLDLAIELCPKTQVKSRTGRFGIIGIES